MQTASQTGIESREVTLTAAGTALSGTLARPDGEAPPQGLVLFAHGSGSSRQSPRNQAVAAVLNRAGLATLLLDLLTAEEEAVDRHTREHRFDVDLLAARLAGTAAWARAEGGLAGAPLGYIGASTGAAAALLAAAQHPAGVGAVVSRGGRPDLARAMLAQVAAPTLLIVGGEDAPVIAMNEAALAQLTCEKALQIVPGATHLFEEPGTLEAVAGLARDWFRRHLRAGRAGSAAAGEDAGSVAPG
jgi:putative phosphoribosyl transferase